MKFLRLWATPLTIGTFVLVGITGVLMFFHNATAFNKNVHEWGGLIMIAAVVVHAIVNGAAFKRYFISNTMGQTIIGLCLIVLAGSFITLSGKQSGGPPMKRTFYAVVHAPIVSVAPLTDKTPEQMIADLTKIGITISDPQQNLDAATGGNRELQEKAIILLFPQMK